jgi:hypothetical protein
MAINLLAMSRRSRNRQRLIEARAPSRDRATMRAIRGRPEDPRRLSRPHPDVDTDGRTPPGRYHHEPPRQ